MKNPDKLGAPTGAILTKAMKACLANGENLLDDAQMLEFQEPPARMLTLSVLAQEEFAKSFVLFLVREGIIPRTTNVRRAMNDHACKHLLGAILDYVSPRHDETFEEMISNIREEIARGDELPLEVADAIWIFRHEKIGRWESHSWDWTEPPRYDRNALSIAKGRRDRLKQDALYVRVGRDGHIVSTPQQVSKVTSDVEFERARSYGDFLCSLFRENRDSSTEYKKVVAFIAVIFQ